MTIEEELEVRATYLGLIAGWNKSDAALMTRDLADQAHVIGFDGSPINGRDANEKAMAAIFADHQVARYVPLLREIREVAAGVAVLRAEVGMVPPGTSKIAPDRNAVQTLVAAKHAGRWQIEVFQNTPAAWHGRDADRDALTAELQAAIDPL